MKYCIFCGKDLPNDAVFCNSCGKKQSSFDEEIKDLSNTETEKALSVAPVQNIVENPSTIAPAQNIPEKPKRKVFLR